MKITIFCEELDFYHGKIDDLSDAGDSSGDNVELNSLASEQSVEFQFRDDNDKMLFAIAAEECAVSSFQCNTYDELLKKLEDDEDDERRMIAVDAAVDDGEFYEEIFQYWRASAEVSLDDCGDVFDGDIIEKNDVKIVLRPVNIDDGYCDIDGYEFEFDLYHKGKYLDTYEFYPEGIKMLNSETRVYDSDGESVAF